MLPPISSTICLVMTSPRPEPPYFLVSDASTWLNLMNSLLILASEIPIPVSATAILILILLSPSSMDAILTLTLPSDVNLIAFESRQLRTCWILCPSPRTSFGILLPNEQSSCSPLLVAIGTCAATVSSMAVLMSNVSSLILYLPASSLLISRISLISLSSVSAQFLAVIRLSL